MKKIDTDAIREAALNGDLDDYLAAILSGLSDRTDPLTFLDKFGALDRALEWATEQYIERCQQEAADIAIAAYEDRMECTGGCHGL